MIFDNIGLIFTRITILLNIPIFLGEILFIIIISRLYYVKIGQIIRDLRKRRSFSSSSSNVLSNNISANIQQVSLMAENKLLDKLVQSIIINVLFLFIIVIEIIAVGFVNYQVRESMESRLMNGITITCIAMVFLSMINTLQAEFNNRLYQKYCKFCHKCCIRCIQRFI